MADSDNNAPRYGTAGTVAVTGLGALGGGAKGLFAGMGIGGLALGVPVFAIGTFLTYAAITALTGGAAIISAPLLISLVIGTVAGAGAAYLGGSIGAGAGALVGTAHGATTSLERITAPAASALAPEQDFQLPPVPTSDLQTQSVAGPSTELETGGIRPGSEIDKILSGGSKQPNKSFADAFAPDAGSSKIGDILNKKSQGFASAAEASKLAANDAVLGAAG